MVFSVLLYNLLFQQLSVFSHMNSIYLLKLSLSNSGKEIFPPCIFVLGNFDGNDGCTFQLFSYQLSCLSTYSGIALFIE